MRNITKYSISAFNVDEVFPTSPLKGKRKERKGKREGERKRKREGGRKEREKGRVKDNKVRRGKEKERKGKTGI